MTRTWIFDGATEPLHYSTPEMASFGHLTWANKGPYLLTAEVFFLIMCNWHILSSKLNQYFLKEQ